MSSGRPGRVYSCCSSFESIFTSCWGCLHQYKRSCWKVSPHKLWVPADIVSALIFFNTFVRNCAIHIIIYNLNSLFYVYIIDNCWKQKKYLRLKIKNLNMLYFILYNIYTFVNVIVLGIYHEKLRSIHLTNITYFYSYTCYWTYFIKVVLFLSSSENTYFLDTWDKNL